MFGNDNEGLATLKTLTDTLADSINGYRDAAEHVELAQFRQMFTQLADERSQVLTDLQSELSRLGGSAERDGTTLGHIHQRWLDLKASITGQDDKAVINEVERGEDYLKEKFETALSANLLESSVRTPIKGLCQARQGHDRVAT